MGKRSQGVFMSLLSDKIKTGRSLIYVQSLDAHEKVKAALRVKLVPYFSTVELGPGRALARYFSYLPNDAALLCHLPALTVGCAIKADRVIWIDGKVYAVGCNMHQQAVARANRLGRSDVECRVLQESDI
jgi:hypothetical protein